MVLKRIFSILMGLAIIGCSVDNDQEFNQGEPIPTSFDAIGLTVGSVFQYTFDAAEEAGELSNLTVEVGVPTDYLTLRQTANLISFYTFSEGSFSLRLKDIVTGETATYSDFFANSAGRSVAWGINDESNVFFGFFGPDEKRNLGIQDVNFSGDLDGDTTIAINVDFTFQPLLFDDKIYVVYRDEMDNYKLTFYDTATKTSGPILNFASIPVSFLVSDLGEIVVIKNGADATLGIYDAATLELMEELPLQFGTAFDPGPVDGAVFKDAKLYYAFPYAQPALYEAGPAIFDLGTQENRIIDFFGIAQRIESELGESIRVTTQVYDADNNVFLVGYAVLADATKGGILQISTEGELMAHVLVPFFPKYIVRN